ncbi:MAG: sugar-binding transcriptional regulator [Bacillota bacterium]
MKDIFILQQKIVPELIEVLERRYTILRNLSLLQPVGRRALAQKLGFTERLVRGDLDLLRERGLVVSDAAGMSLTGEGEDLLQRFSVLFSDLHGLTELERQLQNIFQLGRAIVVPGDSDEDSTVKKEIGRATARYIREILRDKSILAVTGGTTLGEVAEAVAGYKYHCPATVVPARGGLGEDVEIQANTIAARIAKILKGSYRLLHVPDNIGAEAMRSLSMDPKIREVVKTIKSADILVHGIGNAGELSVSRGDLPVETRRLMEGGAVGEAFGHYFAIDGSIVHNIHSLGVRLNDLAKIPHVIGVAGGKKKARAIMAVMSNKFEDVLITDEGAAREIIKQKSGSGTR